MERKIIFLFLFLILINFVSAEDPNQKIGTNVDIYKSVRFNGGLIPNATCGITIFQNQSALIPYTNMSYNPSSETFNYTLSNQYTSIAGDYPYDITCCANGICTTEHYKFILSRSGKEATIQGAFFHFSMLLIAIGIFILSLFIFFKVEGKDQYNDYDGLVAVNWTKYPKWLMLLIAYYTFIWIMYSSYNIAYGFLEVDGMSKVFYMLYTYPLWIAPFIFLVFILLSIYSGVRDLMNMKEINRFGEA